MKTIRLTLISLAAAFGALVASAQQAQVISVTGSATVLKPGASVAVPVVVGETLAEGSLVTTAGDGSVLIQSHTGIETGLGANSSAAIGSHGVSAEGIRTAVIDLKSGTTVSVLDPSKRAVNNYAVRTPKGVAAARGTTYSTTVKLSSGGEAVVTVNTLTGAVSFSIVGGSTVAVTEGNSASSTTGSSTTIAAAIAAATPAEKADIAEALRATVTVAAVVAQVNQTTADAASTSSTLQAVVTAVTNAAAALPPADSGLANTIVSSTVTAVRTYAGENATNAVTAIETAAATNPAVAGIVETAKAAPVAPVEIPPVAPPSPSTPPAPIVVPPSPTEPNPIPDITISPSS